VARAAGVGVGTVSRVLNDHPAVTEETRERVRSAIEQLDYRPSPLARGLKRGTTHRIGVLVSFFTSPSAVERLRGLTQELVGTGYEIVLYPSEDEEQRAAHMDSLSGPHQADGLILIALPPREEEIERLERSALCVVQVADAPHPNFSSVVVDDVRGGALAANHLLELGHRLLAFVGDPEDNPPHGFTSSRDRCDGFRSTLAAAGCAPPDSWIRTATHGTEEAAHLARDLLAGDDRPTAVFAASDTQALGVMLAARELGLRVPEDVSVLGFDDVEVAAHIGLSTVRQPLHESGVVAARLVLDAMASPGDR
jgi:DNA-binding LacI/PurR family transcriptional regulator